MKQPSRKKKRVFSKATLVGGLVTIAGLALGGAGGFALVDFIDKHALSPAGAVGLALCALLGLYLSFFLHIILHEGGHLVCGLATGCGFCSFRIGSFMFVKREGRIVCKRLSMMGTGGQCLLSPPEPYHKDIPFLLYNLGGSLSNFLFSGVALAVFLLWGASLPPIVTVQLVIFIGIGVFLGVSNIIPLRISGLDNDGRNALILKKEPLSHYLFWLQLHINAKIDGGARLKDLPDELFVAPGPLDLSLGLHSTLAVFSCMRTLDKGDYPAAVAEIDSLLARAPQLMAVHRCLLVSERIFCGYLLGESHETFERFYTKEFKQFLKTMTKMVTTQRLLYAVARLGKPDAAAAQKALTQFEKAAKRYPNPNEIVGEREHMAAIDAACAKGEAAL